MNPVEVTVEERGRQKTKGHSARGEKARVRVYLNLLQKKVPRPSQVRRVSRLLGIRNF